MITGLLPARAHLAGLLLAVVWIGGCNSSANEDQTVGTGSHEPPPVNVAVVDLQPSPITERVVLTGRLEPWVEVEVSSELGGTVQEIGFEKGQRVGKGQVLARVGTDLLEAAQAEAKAGLVEAEANYNKTRELFERQAVPRQELITYTSRFETAKARVEAAKLRVERSIITAPVGGVAINRHVDVGEVVPPGAAITTIHQINRLKVEVGIPEDQFPYFHVGSRAAIEIDAYPGQEFEGRIHFLGVVASDKSRTFPSEVAISNPDGELRPGMIARVYLVKRQLDDALVVPRDALLERDTGSVAFVQVNDKAEERPVVLGPVEGNRVVILQGLSAGESLIVSGHRNLVDGQAVRVVSSDQVEPR